MRFHSVVVAWEERKKIALLQIVEHAKTMLLRI